MTCSFCGRSDDSIGDLTLHYRKHTIETLQRLVKAVETVAEILDERLSAPTNEMRLSKIEQILEKAGLSK